MEMPLPVFLLIETVPDPEQTEALNRYLAKAPNVFQAYGAVTVASYDIATQLRSAKLNNPTQVQDEPDSRGISVISFPDRESILALFNGASYQGLLADRDLAFKHIAFYIGNEPLEWVNALGD